MLNNLFAPPSSIGLSLLAPPAPSGGAWGDASPQTPAKKTLWRMVERVLVRATFSRGVAYPLGAPASGRCLPSRQALAGERLGGGEQRNEHLWSQATPRYRTREESAGLTRSAGARCAARPFRLGPWASRPSLLGARTSRPPWASRGVGRPSPQGHGVAARHALIPTCRRGRVSARSPGNNHPEGFYMLTTIHELCTLTH